MKSRIAFFLMLAMAWASMAVGQQLTESPGKGDPAAAKVGGASKTAPPAKAPAYKAKASKAVDPDAAYKANCSRCHLEPRKYSERKTATIVRHMQVRGNLTEEEAKAILGYLTK